MKIALVITLAFAVSSVVAAPKNVKCSDCSCSKLSIPVCGSDDETYDNKCKLACAQGCNSKIKLVHKGRCGSRTDIDDETTTLANLEGVTEAPSKDEADEPVKVETETVDDDTTDSKIVEEIIMMEMDEVEITTSRNQISNDEEEQTTTKN